MSNQRIYSWTLTALTVPRRPEEEASSDPREAVAGDGAVADDAAIAECVYHVAATSRSRLIVAAVVVEYSLSFLLAPYVAYRMPEWHKGVADNVVGASSTARDSWWTPRSDCNSLHRPAMPPATVLQANSRSVSVAAVAVDPRSMMRAN